MLVNLEPDDPGDPHTFELTGDLRERGWPTGCRRARASRWSSRPSHTRCWIPLGPSESLRAEVVDVRVVG